MALSFYSQKHEKLFGLYSILKKYSALMETKLLDIYNTPPRNLPKSKFTLDDDKRLFEIVNQIGTSSWQDVSKMMKNRNPRQCKERWENYLNPELNNGPWSEEEDMLLIKKQQEIGSKWASMTQYFNKRSESSLRNRWQLLDRKIKKEYLKITSNQHTDICNILMNNCSIFNKPQTQNTSKKQEIQQKISFEKFIVSEEEEMLSFDFNNDDYGIIF